MVWRQVTVSLPASHTWCHVKWQSHYLPHTRDVTSSDSLITRLTQVVSSSRQVNSLITCLTHVVSRQVTSSFIWLTQGCYFHVKWTVSLPASHRWCHVKWQSHYLAHTGGVIFTSSEQSHYLAHSGGVTSSDSLITWLTQVVSRQVTVSLPGSHRWCHVKWTVSLPGSQTLAPLPSSLSLLHTHTHTSPPPLSLSLTHAHTLIHSLMHTQREREREIKHPRTSASCAMPRITVDSGKFQVQDCVSLQQIIRSVIGLWRLTTGLNKGINCSQ